MPPRIIVAVILGLWFASTGYLVYREWWSWRQTDEPPFTVELADEAAPQTALWSIWRNDQKIGHAMTRMTCEKDDTVELLSSIDNLELTVNSFGTPVQISVPKLLTIQKVTRKGKLISIDSRLQIILNVGQKLELKAHIIGVVNDGKLHARTALDSILGKSEHVLEPIALESGSLHNPTQPRARMPPVRPGQRWKITLFDPLGEAIQTSILQAFGRKSGATSSKLVDTQISLSKALLVLVASEPSVLTHKDNAISCHVAEYRSDDLDGKTWVQVTDGKVLRQEASFFGDNLVLRRED